MNYQLTVKETGNKAGKFHYIVKDENGKMISERKSNREYVACTISGSNYFGRLNLVGKGDHGKVVARQIENNITPEPVAYLVTPTKTQQVLDKKSQAGLSLSNLSNVK